MFTVPVRTAIGVCKCHSQFASANSSQRVRAEMQQSPGQGDDSGHLFFLEFFVMKRNREKRNTFDLPTIYRDLLTHAAIDIAATCLKPPVLEDDTTFQGAPVLMNFQPRAVKRAAGLWRLEWGFNWRTLPRDGELIKDRATGREPPVLFDQNFGGNCWSTCYGGADVVVHLFNAPTDLIDGQYKFAWHICSVEVGSWHRSRSPADRVVHKSGQEIVLSEIDRLSVGKNWQMPLLPNGLRGQLVLTGKQSGCDEDTVMIQFLLDDQELHEDWVALYPAIQVTDIDSYVKGRRQLEGQMPTRTSV